MNAARQCKGKRKYDTMRNAERAVFAMWENGRVRNGEVHAYHCPVCNQYHVGHVPREQRPHALSEERKP